MRAEEQRNRGISGAQGSVLMETALVIPLYIAFLSGIFLLGDLTLGRSHLIAADRFGVWLSGTRHAEMESDEVKKETSEAFLSNDQFAEGTEVESLRMNPQEVNWYSIVRGGAKLKMVLPQWAVGCRKGVLRLLADIGTSPEKKMWDDIAFKAREIEENDTHTVLMRAEYEDREKTARELALGTPGWYQEYRTAYIDREGVPNDTPSSRTVCAGTEYQRQGEYDLWSK